MQTCCIRMSCFQNRILRDSSGLLIIWTLNWFFFLCNYIWLLEFHSLLQCLFWCSSFSFTSLQICFISCVWTAHTYLLLEVRNYPHSPQWNRYPHRYVLNPSCEYDVSLRIVIEFHVPRYQEKTPSSHKNVKKRVFPDVACFRPILCNKKRSIFRNLLTYVQLDWLRFADSDITIACLLFTANANVNFKSVTIFSYSSNATQVILFIFL